VVRMTRIMLVGVCGLLLGAGFAPSATQAQAVGERLKLGLEATLFEYADVEITPDGSNTGASAKSTTFGVAPGMGFDIAYGVGRMIVLGARFGLSVNSIDVEGTETDVTELQLHPHLDFVFGEGTSHGFAGLVTGVDLANTDAADVTAFPIGASVGGIFFINSNVSIDPRLQFVYEIGSVSADAGGDADVSGFVITGLLGISGWN